MNVSLILGALSDLPTWNLSLKARLHAHAGVTWFSAEHSERTANIGNGHLH